MTDKNDSEEGASGGSGGPGDEPSRVDPFQEYEDKLKSIEESIEKSEKAQEEMIKKVEDNCKTAIHSKLDTLGDEFRTVVDSTLSNMGNFYDVQAKSRIETKQVQVLRVNKVIRDISRSLGPDWRVVFDFLTSSYPKDVVETELRKIERQRPHMQPYKALLTWKELAGNNVDLMDLVDALKIVNNYELVEKVLDTMDCEGDSLLALENVGKGVRRGSSLDESGSAAAAGGGEDGSSATGGRPTIQRLSSTQETEDPLSNANLLKISRQLDAVWPEVGRVLGLTEEEISEIQEAEAGNSKRAAFKMMWTWKDKLDEYPASEDILALAQAVEGVGKEDLAKSLRDSQGVSSA